MSDKRERRRRRWSQFLTFCRGTWCTYWMVVTLLWMLVDHD